MSARDSSDETGWPLTRTERDWNRWQLFAVLLVTAAATWCYIIGEYVGRAFLTVSGKPQSLVRCITENEGRPA